MSILTKSTPSNKQLEEHILQEIEKQYPLLPLQIHRDMLEVESRGFELKELDKLVDICKQYGFSTLYINNSNTYCMVYIDDIHKVVENLTISCKNPALWIGGCDIKNNVRFENIILSCRDSKTYELNEEMEVINYKGHFLFEMSFYGANFHDIPKNFTYKNSYYNLRVSGKQFDMDKFYNKYKPYFDNIPLPCEIFWVDGAKTYYLSDK